MPQRPANIGSSFIVDEDSDSDMPINSVGASSLLTPIVNIDDCRKPEEGNPSIPTIADSAFVPSNTVVQPVVELRRSKRTPCPVFRDGYISYFTRDCSAEDPLTREEAMNVHDKDKWLTAMKEELASFEANGTWSMVDLPYGRKPIKTK